MKFGVKAIFSKLTAPGSKLIAQGLLLIACFIIMLTSCDAPSRIQTNNNQRVRLVTLDPGHFHAALVQKIMYPDVDSIVHVYAPSGPDVQLHLDRIKAYNSRKENPTFWKEEVNLGTEFFEKMISAKKGNVVVLSGNNEKKTSYIRKSIEAGWNVLADKPMAIDKESFEELKNAFATASSKNLLLYDIMTERYEITTILQREFSMVPEVFGILEKGSPENPAVTKESTHFFYKYVSGSVLTRPAWFMDVKQEGEGIVDVTTHLVDLIQWECFPEQSINYKNDIQLISAKRWPTEMTLGQFNRITKLNGFPSYLLKDVEQDTILKVYSNGEINYKLKGVYAKASVTWGIQAQEGTGDTHFSVMRGSLANLFIRQGAEQNHKATLYIEPVQAITAAYESKLLQSIQQIRVKYPGIEVKKNNSGWEVLIPESYKEGHEAHFARVMEKYLQYLKNGNIPVWEVPNMIAKYYTTTMALDLARKTIVTKSK